MKWFTDLVRNVMALIGFGSLFFGLGFAWPRVTDTIQRTTPNELEIESATRSPEALGQGPRFLTDHISWLEKEDFTSFVLKSARLSQHPRFKWRLSIRSDFREDYQLSCREVYLVRKVRSDEWYLPVDWGYEDHFYSISALIPESELDDRVVIVLGISGGGRPIPQDITSILRTKIN